MHLVYFSLKFVSVRKMSYEVDNLGIVSHGKRLSTSMGKLLATFIFQIAVL